MPADDEGSVLEISSPETQFISQEDDDELLWEVVEITGETGKHYKVNWAGVDPKTGKAWPESWVPKHDCTDDIVVTWKTKQAKKKKGLERKDAAKRESVSAKKSGSSAVSQVSKGSSASTSTVKGGASTSTVTATNKKSASGTTKGKRKLDSRKSVTSEGLPDITTLLRDEEPSRPRKKRKVQVEILEPETVSASPVQSSFEVRKKPSGKVVPQEDDGDVVEISRAFSKSEGKRRAQSPSDHGERSTSTVSKRKDAATKKQSKGEKEKQLQERQVTERGDNEKQLKERQKKEKEEKEKQLKERQAKEKEKEREAKEKLLKEQQAKESEAKEKQLKETEAKEKQSKNKQPKENEPKANRLASKESLAVVNGAPSAKSSSTTASTRKVTATKVASSSRGSSEVQLSGSARSSTGKRANGHSRVRSKSRVDSDEDEVSPFEPAQPIVPARTPTPPLAGRDRTASPLLEVPEIGYSPPQNVGPLDPELSPLAKSRLAEFDAALLKVQKLVDEYDDQPAPAMEDTYDQPVDVQDEQVDQEESDIHSQLDPEFKHERQDELDEEQQEEVSGKLPLFLPGSPSESELELTYPKTETEVPSKASKKSKSASTNYSYEHEIVPETDSSRNNTESQETQPEVPVPVKTPSRATIKSRMKPRTPRSAGGSKLSLYEDDHVDHYAARPSAGKPLESDASPKSRGTSKLLGPIPHISPSMFTALLPSSSAPLNSTIETADDELMSSQEDIEQFDSPEKPDTDSPKLARNRRATSDASASSVEQRGQALAEAAKERARKERGEERPNRISLIDIMKSNSWSDGRREKDKLTLFAGREHIVPSTAQDSDSDNMETAVLQEMEAAYVDLSGGASVEENQTMDTEPSGEVLGEHRVECLVLHEEEESTQDIIQDTAKARNMDEVDIDAGWNVPGSQDNAQQSGASGYEPGDDSARMDESMDDLQAPLQQLSSPPGPSSDSGPSSNPIPSSSPPPQQEPHEEQPLTNIEPVRTISRSPSGSKSRAQSERPTKATDQNPDPEIPKATRLDTPEAAISYNPEHFPDGPPKDLSSAMMLLEVKSEEITKLDYQLSFELDKNDALAKELETLREAFDQSHSGPSSKELTLEQELAEARQVLEAEKVKWQVEREALTTSMNLATSAKAQAVKDRDFFQDNYRQASAFVSSVRDENTELEQRANIAEEQAKSGVALVRATFEQRLKVVEEDAKVWKKMAMFVMEKDQRTNDEIRRRAAEEPEIRAECERLEGMLEGAGNQISVLERQLTKTEAEGRRLENQADVWKQEVTRLNVELNEIKAKLDVSSKGREMNGTPSDIVYRCQWRLEGTDGSCDALFVKVEDLQNHLYTGGHIHD